MAIDQFSKTGDYFFLSSMYPVGGGIETEEGVTAKSAENIYQASKFEDPNAQLEVLGADTGYAAKKVANRLESSGVPIREDWSEVRVDKMREAVARKFADGTKLAKMLILTGEEDIIQGNTHGDNFWGVSPPGNPNGKNMLGKILMKRRDELSSSRAKR